MHVCICIHDRLCMYTSKGPNSSHDNQSFSSSEVAMTARSNVLNRFCPTTAVHLPTWAVWHLQLFTVQKLEELCESGAAPYSDLSCPVVSPANTSLTWSDCGLITSASAAAPRLCPLHLMLPASSAVTRWCHFNLAAPNLRPLQLLLLLKCVC